MVCHKTNLFAASHKSGLAGRLRVGVLLFQDSVYGGNGSASRVAAFGSAGDDYRTLFEHHFVVIPLRTMKTTIGEVVVVCEGTED